ncbi:MAG: photosystem I reaction center subunit XII [Cyanothece sp. SIO1E1]|nr:photosystem I reaction center subunit XII [Cyanothece sp. SIO1E1]
MGNLTLSASLGLDLFEEAPSKRRPLLTEDEIQVIIRSVYRQVLGNIHIMDDQRLGSAEAQLRNGDITVKEFVRAVAQSDLYRSLFFETASAYRFIELNFKHLLGRAPQDQTEISEHVCLYQEQGYAAEINSYIDSEEYNSSFDADTVPYPRSIRTQAGIKNEGFNRMFSLLRGSATSDRGKPAQLISSIAANLATPIKPPVKLNSFAYSNTVKRFEIAFASSQASAQLQGRSKQSCVVPYSLMSQTIRNIHRSGGRILNISEAA